MPRLSGARGGSTLDGMDAPFETIEHTADIGLRAHGASLPELYANAARGLLSLLAAAEKVRPLHEETVTVEGEDAVGLMVAWLHEILFRFSARRTAFAGVEVLELRPWRLTARLRGEPLDPARHDPGEEIKAVTWHGARVEERDGVWTAEVLLDL
jgi:SHS2 domain-containing protein